MLEQHYINKYFNGHRLSRQVDVPLTPYTLRLQYPDGFTPWGGGNYKQISVSPNIWDWTLNQANWGHNGPHPNKSCIAVLGGNTRGVTNMESLFERCEDLESCVVFDTSNVTNMQLMFDECKNLKNVPLLNTSKLDEFNGANFLFNGCYKVESGALAMYNQLSQQYPVPSHNSYTFANCGRDTETGLAELQQIPTDWGGLKA